MGFVSAASDAAVAILALSVAASSLLVVAQSVLPPSLYPEPLRALKRWYAAEFDDYLVATAPGFFRGLAWLELAFLCPLCVATLYAVLARRRWAPTASLVLGVAIFTSWWAILGDILETGRATPKLLLSYGPFALLAVIAIFRGLCSCSERATTAGSSHGPSSRKKRV